MARKSKKKVDDFAEALMSKTKLIKHNQPQESAPPKATDNNVYAEVDKKVYGKFKILAMHQKTQPETLINEALNHYLRLKQAKLEQAVYELTKED